MPRVCEESGRDAVVVPGVYSALLERESIRSRRVSAGSGGGFFQRPRRLLGALQAGEPVTVPRSVLHAVLHVERLSWPADVRSVVVSADDEVRPCDDSVKGAV